MLKELMTAFLSLLTCPGKRSQLLFTPPLSLPALMLLALCFDTCFR
jgi:hypothetical protein